MKLHRLSNTDALLRQKQSCHKILLRTSGEVALNCVKADASQPPRPPHQSVGHRGDQIQCLRILQFKNQPLDHSALSRRPWTVGGTIDEASTHRLRTPTCATTIPRLSSNQAKTFLVNQVPLDHTSITATEFYTSRANSSRSCRRADCELASSDSKYCSLMQVCCPTAANCLPFYRNDKAFVTQKELEC